MKDYWTKLNLSDAWSDKDRFNFIMDYIDGQFTVGATTPPPLIEEEDDDLVNTATINVSIKNEDDEGVNGATVSVYNNTNEYTGTTGTQGGCTIKNVIYGDYTISVTHEDYDELIDSLTVGSTDIDFNGVLGFPTIAQGGSMDEEVGEL